MNEISLSECGEETEQGENGDEMPPVAEGDNLGGDNLEDELDALAEQIMNEMNGDGAEEAAKSDMADDGENMEVFNETVVTDVDNDSPSNKFDTNKDNDVASEDGQFAKELGESSAHSGKRSKAAGSKGGGKNEVGVDRRSLSESRSKDFKALALKVNTILKENKELKKLHKDYESKMSNMKNKLYEAAVIAEKTVHVNRLLMENSLTQDEKTSVVEKFVNISSREDARMMFESTKKDLAKGTKEPLIESKITNTIKSSSSTLTEQTVVKNEEGGMAKRWGELINYGRDKN